MQCYTFPTQQTMTAAHSADHIDQIDAVDRPYRCPPPPDRHVGAVVTRTKRNPSATPINGNDHVPLMSSACDEKTSRAKVQSPTGRKFAVTCQRFVL